MRIITFKMGPESRTECYVTLLGGQAGGIEDNINRWCRQMGLPGLSSEEIERLPDLQILDQDAKYVELTGTYTDMGGEVSPEYGLLGAICTLPDSTIFIKMTGPEEEVLPERENFKSFCQSLSLP